MTKLRSHGVYGLSAGMTSVSDLVEPDSSSSIAQAIVSIAAARHMTTTAEGVETRQQQELLRALGCAEMQGYLFSPARPAAELKRLFFSHDARREVMAQV